MKTIPIDPTYASYKVGIELRPSHSHRCIKTSVAWFVAAPSRLQRVIWLTSHIYTPSIGRPSPQDHFGFTPPTSFSKAQGPGAFSLLHPLPLVNVCPIARRLRSSSCPYLCFSNDPRLVSSWSITQSPPRRLSSKSRGPAHSLLQFAMVHPPGLTPPSGLVLESSPEASRSSLSTRVQLVFIWGAFLINPSLHPVF